MMIPLIINSLKQFSAIVGSTEFLLGALTISLVVKAVILYTLIMQGLRSAKIQRAWFFIVGVLTGSMFESIVWIFRQLNLSFPNEIPYPVVVFMIRISWVFLLVQYQSLALFIASLIEKEPRLRWPQQLCLTLSGTVASFFLYITFFGHYSASKIDRELYLFQEPYPLELYMMQIVTPLIFVILLPTLLSTLYKIRFPHIPRILKRQFNLFIRYIILPYFVAEILQSLETSYFHTYFAGQATLTSLSTLLLTYALYFCTRKMMGLRFLNFNNHVQSHHTFNFIDDFKTVLEQLSHATSMQELAHVTQTFFKEALRIPLSRTNIYIRNLSTTGKQRDNNSYNIIESTVENFITTHDTTTCKVADFLRQHKVLITDEVEFSNFYEDNALTEIVVNFLRNINADIFLPIYDQQTIVGYIIVERHARLTDFYSNIERDELVVFASYLGNTINLLRNKNVNSLIEQTKDMREELYAKHQQINQHRESIRSFLRSSERKIGILFYKNRRFIFGNQAAKELIRVNINTQEGHPLTRAIKQAARQVEEYKAPQHCQSKDDDGNRLVISAIPNLEHNNVIITVHYPEIADIIKQQLQALNDPSEFDYLLYLETTQCGKLINQLVPSTGETLINFKINLLKTALSKKATLLHMPEDDLMPTVELLHHISLRDRLHVLRLQAAEHNTETAIKLFGINPIFGASETQPIMEQFNHAGTLFIQNIHFLSLETQRHLAEFIKYGYYHPFKSDQKLFSDVRIICSTNHNLQTLVNDGAFSRELFDELKETTLAMPSLVSLPEQELAGLADGFTRQAVNSNDLHNLFELTDKEKTRIALNRPESIQALKKRVQNMLTQKSRESNIYEETQFDPAYSMTDPELINAARLGKQALKDPQVMALLWHKFKNQNKIATLLGVNRSSVNRRCKEYNLE